MRMGEADELSRYAFDGYDKSSFFRGFGMYTVCFAVFSRIHISFGNGAGRRVLLYEYEFERAAGTLLNDRSVKV